MTAFALGIPNVDEEIWRAIQFVEEAQELESFDDDWPWPRQSMRDYAIDITGSIDKMLPFLAKWVCLDQSYRPWCSSWELTAVVKRVCGLTPALTGGPSNARPVRVQRVVRRHDQSPGQRARR